MYFKTSEDEKHMTILEIKEYPFSEKYLKSQYRKMAFRFHPDINPEEAEKQMTQINLAYEYLKEKTVSEFINGKAKKAFVKTDMFDMSEMCKSCDGDGYHLREIPEREACPDCQGNFLFKWFSFLSDNRGNGYHYEKCPSCLKGFHPSGKPCNRCRGTGLIKQVCKTCNGKGFTLRKETVLKETCHYCKGTGRIEIKPFNPVIKKGAVLF